MLASQLICEHWLYYGEPKYFVLNRGHKPRAIAAGATPYQDGLSTNTVSARRVRREPI
jgi:hypothetical protein